MLDNTNDGLASKNIIGNTMKTQIIVDRIFRTTFASGLSYVPSTGLSKHDRTKETQGAFG